VYSEYFVYKVPIKKGSNTIQVLLPAKYINNKLRVDLVNKAGHYKINDFTLYNISFTQ